MVQKTRKVIEHAQTQSVLLTNTFVVIGLLFSLCRGFQTGDELVGCLIMSAVHVPATQHCNVYMFVDVHIKFR